MASSINSNNPTAGLATTESVRANFSAAKSEIEYLQGLIGFADYSDSASAQSITANTWTKLTNNGAGAYTLKKLPTDVSDVWNTSTSQLSLSSVPLYSMVDVRLDLSVTTTSANQVVQLRASMGIGSSSAFTLQTSEHLFKTSGTRPLVVTIPFYIGYADVKNYPGEFQVFSDSSCTVDVNGWYIRVIKPQP